MFISRSSFILKCTQLYHFVQLASSQGSCDPVKNKQITGLVYGRDNKPLVSFFAWLQRDVSVPVSAKGNWERICRQTVGTTEGVSSCSQHANILCRAQSSQWAKHNVMNVGTEISMKIQQFICECISLTYLAKLENGIKW